MSLLAEASAHRLRTLGLRAAGFATVGAVYRADLNDLKRAAGVGPATAERAKEAAARVAREAQDRATVLLDPAAPSADMLQLVALLQPFVDADPHLERLAAQAAELAAQLGLLLPDVSRKPRRLRLWLPGRHRQRAADAEVRLGEVAAAIDADGVGDAITRAAELTRCRVSVTGAWDDFLARPAAYYAALERLTGATAPAPGWIPDALVARVRAQPLDTAGLRVSLRGYQEFGARYALAGRRVILGDEMGLGKTVQAIAVMNHLARHGEQHFVVACPASVLVNWVREIGRHCGLTPHLVHGSGRQGAGQAWVQAGGVAVTTYQGLAHLPWRGLPGRPGLLIVDEAHQVKNPDALRSQRVAELAACCDRVLFLTGTALENHLGELRALISYLQPQVLDRLPTQAAVREAATVREAISPVYLRRNQAEVLAELPAQVRVDEWVRPVDHDVALLQRAVRARNFQAARRAACVHPSSSKLARLLELVRDAAGNGEKVLVFSFFHDVLATAHAVLTDPVAVHGAAVFGPVTGQTSARTRQAEADRFTTHQGPAVLLAQIESVGIGVNLQAASVVVLTEPQVKPSLEAQAVARAHRMGQLRRVRVHRLLTPDSVDERLLELLAAKERQFAAFARHSHAADGDPAARDGLDAAAVRRLLDDEAARLDRSDPA